jgi:hypothetical protein
MAEDSEKPTPSETDLEQIAAFSSDMASSFLSSGAKRNS